MPKPKSTARAVSTPKDAPAPRRRAARRNQSGNQRNLPRYLSLMVDPFHQDAAGAARPDHNSAPTVVWAEQGAFTTSTNADGNFWLQFTPACKGLYYTAVFSAGTPVISSQAPSDAPNYTEVFNTFGTFRPYTIAVEVEYIGQADAQKGVIGACTNREFLNTGWNQDVLFDEPCYREQSSDMKLATCMRFNDNTSFNPVSSEMYGAGVSPTAVIHIIGNGLPASAACIRVRWRLVGEYTVGSNKLMSREAAVSPVHMAQVSAAANIVSVDTMVAFDKTDPVQKIVKRAGQLAEIAGALNGLWQTAKPLGELMADMTLMLA